METFLVDTPYKGSHQIFVDAHTIPFAYLFQSTNGDIAVHHTKFTRRQMCALDEKSLFSLITSPCTLFVVFQKAVFPVQTGVMVQAVILIFTKLRVHQSQILIGQFL